MHITDNDIVILDSIAQGMVLGFVVIIEKINEITGLLIRTPVEQIPDLYTQNKEFHDSVAFLLLYYLD